MCYDRRRAGEACVDEYALRSGVGPRKKKDGVTYALVARPVVSSFPTGSALTNSERRLTTSVVWRVWRQWLRGWAL